MGVASMLVPGDFDTQMAAIDRKRKIIDALAQQTSNPQGQMVSGHYIAPNILAQLADLGGGALQAFGNKALDEQASKANQDYQTGLGDEVNKYLKTRSGYTQEMQGPNPDGSAMEPQVVKGDPRQAMVDAISSQYKPMQQLGMAELGSLGKSAMTPKDIFALTGEGKYTPSSVKEAATTGDLSKLVPMGKTMAVNNQVVRVGDNDAPVSLGDFRDRFGDVGAVGVGADGKPILGQKNVSTGEAKFAPQGTTVNVDTGAKGASAFSVKSNEAAVKRIEDSMGEAQKAQAVLPTFLNAKALVNDLPGGIAAAPIQTTKRLLAMFGVDDPSIAGTEQAIAALKQGILENAKTLGSGSGFTNQDYNELAKIVGADPSLSKETLTYALNKAIAGSVNKLRNHVGLLKDSENIDGASPEVLNAFRVAIPHYSLNPDEFDLNTDTHQLTAKGSGMLRKEAAAVAPANGGLSPEQQARYEYLAKKHGVK